MPMKGPNVELWRAKFARTRARDQRASRLAEALDYRPIRVWECDISENLEAVAERIRKAATDVS